MKSAYELAMERLEKAAPTQKLTEAQKADIADIESLYQSKIAEREVFLASQLVKARQSGDLGEIDAIEKQLASEIRRLTAECEEKKGNARAAR
jgi:hypothetical protein